MPAVTGLPAEKTTVRIRNNHLEPLMAFLERPTLQMCFIIRVIITPPDSITTSQPLKDTIVLWKSFPVTPADAENVIIHRWDQSKSRILSFRFPFIRTQTVSKNIRAAQKPCCYSPYVVVLVDHNTVHQTFSYPPKKAHSKKAHQSFRLLMKLSKVESISSNRGSIFKPVFPPFCRPKSLSCTPVPSDSLRHSLCSFFSLSLSPFKQDSNSSTQVLSTLLLLPLHHLLFFSEDVRNPAAC